LASGAGLSAGPWPDPLWHGAPV